MNHPTTLPSVEIDIVNITKNTKGFKVKINPIDNTENIQYYNIYLSDYLYSTEPDSNSNNLLIKQLPFSESDQYCYYIPNSTGTYYLTVFLKNNLGLESSGVLFSGVIPYQNLIQEVSIRNKNYYTSGAMQLLGNENSIIINESFALLGCQLDYSSEADSEYYANEGFFYKDFSTYFKGRSIRIHNRVIPALENNSGILFDQTVLRNTSNDVFFSSSLSRSIEKNFFTNNDLYISDINLVRSSEYPSLLSENNRYYIFDYLSNLDSFSTKNTKYLEGEDSEANILFNSEMDTPESFTEKLLNQTGVTGKRPTSYILTSQPGHYQSYYITTEAIDEEGFSSAGGNINNPNDQQRYTNENGYKIVKVDHNKISRQDVVSMFKNYKRGSQNEIVFEIKGKKPLDIGLDSIIIIPEKYGKNIDDKREKEFFDEFIFLRNLNQIDNNAEKNYKVELVDSQNEMKYNITTYLSSDSPLLKDNIFSAKVYYLNQLQAYSLNAYLDRVAYNSEGLLYYISNTDIIDKYITLNKFIKENKNYTSTIAASYQGLVYFFTPESFPYVSWPNEAYRNYYFNKGGARMLDFEYDGVASGPEFFDYFPIANAYIDNAFPSDEKYKTTYRCLDSYKYTSLTNLEFLNPEDIPSNGINGSDSFLGAYDPGNIGDLQSPNTPDFKSINYDLNYFKAKNIISVRFISAGIQKEDAYAIIEFVLDMSEAEDFIVQGISGTDTVLEKGIKEVNGFNYHYFVAKFVSSCGINTDPVLEGAIIDQKNIIDSKKMISFLVYPTKFKVVEDADDVPFFGDFYLLATSPSNNQFNILKECPHTVLNNDTDCSKGCCVEPSDPIGRRAPYKQFYVLSKFANNQVGNDYPVGKLDGTTNNVFGSLSFRYKALDYSPSVHQIEYKKPTQQFNTLNFDIVCYPEHSVGLDKILIYMKQVNDINNISWKSSDLIDSYIFDDVVKTYPIHLSIPDLSFSKKGPQSFENMRRSYESWIREGLTFAIRFYLIDKSGDTLFQNFAFINNQNI